MFIWCKTERNPNKVLQVQLTAGASLLFGGVRLTSQPMGL